MRHGRLIHGRRGNVVSLGLDLPTGLLDEALHADLVRTCAEIDLDPKVRVVTLRSRRSVFCRGNAPEVRVDGPDGIAAVAGLRVPTLAVLGGDALDGGLELALACDLRIARFGVRVGLTQAPAGKMPFHGGTQRLPRIVGPSRAARMLLLGEILTARRALDAGLVQAVVPAQRLSAEVRSWQRALASRGPQAQKYAKEALRAAADVPLAEGLRLEGDLYVLLETTGDRREGVAAFRDGRKPRFEGK